MRILIVEDEPLLVKHLIKLLAEAEPSAKVAGSTISVASSVQWLLANERPDLILMDIELADGQSFQIFEEVQVKSPVIFTTAYDEYALQAFRVNSIDYLLKPVKTEDLRRALDKLKGLHGANEEQIQRLLNEIRGTKTNYRERILVRAGQKMIPINIDEIGTFYSQNSLSYLVTNGKQRHIVDHTLDELEQTLDPKKFFRANRQYILAHDVINVVHPWFNGKLKVEISLPTDEPIIVSRDKASAFKQWLGG